MKFAITVDDETKESIPTEPKGADKDKYYKVEATCDDGITAEWDYNAWNLKVEDIQKGTKCRLAFNSELTEDDYQKYINAGVAYRRNTYRGKDITSKLTDGSLFKEIESGKFDDIFVGDYITSPTNPKVVWLIADLDNYMNTGSSNILKKHHATIISAVPLTNAKMNSTATTNGGYAGSEMVGYVVGDDGKATQSKKDEDGILDTILNTYIKPVFDNHVISYKNLLTTRVNASLSNKYGSESGASSDCSWYERKLDLMSEVNVFGTTILSSSGYDPGIDSKQYALFQIKPEFINSDGKSSFNYWLKDVATSSYFVGASLYGHSGAASANTQSGVRPRFLIG